MRAMLGMLGVVAVTSLGLFSTNAKADEWYRAPAVNGPTTYVVPAGHWDRDDRYDGRRDWDRDGRRDRWEREREWRRWHREHEWHRDWDRDRDWRRW